MCISLWAYHPEYNCYIDKDGNYYKMTGWSCEKIDDKEKKELQCKIVERWERGTKELRRIIVTE